MTNEQKEIVQAWRTIMQILIKTGYNNLYDDEVSKVANFIRKEVGLD